MIIEISTLEFEAIIGLLEHERHNRQRVIIDMKIEYDYNPPDYLDYAKIAEISKQHIIDTKYELLENAINGLSQILLANYPSIQKLDLKITKPDILDDCRVSITHQYLQPTTTIP